MYVTLRHEYFSAIMSTDVYSKIRHSQDCLRTRKKIERQLHLQLFLSGGPLEFIAIDILGPMSQTRSGNQFVVTITACSSKLIRAIPIPKIMWTYVAHRFLNNWVVLYGTPAIIL